MSDSISRGSWKWVVLSLLSACALDDASLGEEAREQELETSRGALVSDHKRLTTSADGFHDLDVVSAYVYFRQQGAIKRIGTGGGAVTSIVTQETFAGLATDGTTLFWVKSPSAGDDQLQSTRISTGATTTLQSESVMEYPRLQGSTLWNIEIMSIWESYLVRRAKDGSGRTVVATANCPTVEDVRCIHTDSAYVYTVTSSTIQRVPYTAGAGTVPQLVYDVGSSNWIDAMRPDGASYVYFVKNERNVMRVPRTGGAAAAMFDAGQGLRVGDLAPRGASIYALATEYGSYGACNRAVLLRAPKTPGAVAEIVYTVPGECGISVAEDSTYVYWGTSGSLYRSYKR